MNRRHIIAHFRELADMTGKPLKTENASSGLKLIYEGHISVLPHRSRENISVGRVAHQLGLSFSQTMRL